MLMMRKLVLLVRSVAICGIAVATALGSLSANATVILYQNTFDTDTTDIPGTYAPFEFNAAGYEHDPDINVSTPTDSTAFSEEGVLHVHRGLTGNGTSVPYARPELTLSSQDLLGTTTFPSVFSVSVEMGGTSGNASWWGSLIKFDAGIDLDISYGFHPGISYNNFNLCFGGCNATTPSGHFTAVFDTLYPVEMTFTHLAGAYQVDLSVTDPATSTVYIDSKVITYPHYIKTIGIGRWGTGGGDAIFDNLTISTPIPEPNTALLLGFGLVGLTVRRKRLCLKPHESKRNKQYFELYMTK